MRPLLLVDVDGVLNPLGPLSADFRRYRCPLEGPLGSEVYTVHLNHRHGTRLLELALRTGAELVWATTWEEHANEWIAPRIGLPRLPVIPVGTAHGTTRGEMFKTPGVADYVAGRPFVWFDDMIHAADDAYLRAHPGVGAFLLVQVDPRQGLDQRHLDLAAEWLTLSGFSQGR
ncbi:HAD domain-containing protein [Nonomuraea longicatena]|uniref:HAD domain-containing protein n=1 Tax=Nonomuraea longicatena TaxID=83682 RepID=C9W340_9ACTN|nr:secreted protein [Nonomuraea longicatena]